MKHIFASDYDGTLFKDFKIREEDIKAIETFRSMGNKFGVVTGRSINSILDEVKSNNIPFDFLIGVNGGVVLNHKLEEVKVHKIKDEAIMGLLKTIDDFGVRTYGVNDGYNHTTVIYEELISGGDREEFDRIVANGISGMYIGTHSSEDSLELAQKINVDFEHLDVKCFANESYVDIGTVHNSKSTGIAHIVNHYDYLGDVFSVGDSYNDVPMLKDYHGYLMDNGVADLLKFANGGFVNTVGEAIYKAIDTINTK